MYIERRIVDFNFVLWAAALEIFASKAAASSLPISFNMPATRLNQSTVSRWSNKIENSTILQRPRDLNTERSAKVSIGKRVLAVIVEDHCN